MPIATEDLFTDQGPSRDMESAYTRFEKTFSLLEDIYMDRAGGYTDESDSRIPDYKLKYLMDEFTRLTKQVFSQE